MHKINKTNCKEVLICLHFSVISLYPADSEYRLTILVLSMMLHADVMKSIISNISYIMLNPRESRSCGMYLLFLSFWPLYRVHLRDLSNQTVNRKGKIQ